MNPDYNNKTYLAPMTGINSLPFRLLALDYGADLVWTEEINDKQLIGSERKYNAETHVTEYWKNGVMFLATHPDERQKVILHLGTADLDLALEAVHTIQNDVAGICLCCDCPKRYSYQKGACSSLLMNVVNMEKILAGLVSNLDIPVLCKIRKV
ncbi:unnamed protein product [Absidia cylindrospora]